MTSRGLDELKDTGCHTYAAHQLIYRGYTVSYPLVGCEGDGSFISLSPFVRETEHTIFVSGAIRLVDDFTDDVLQGDCKAISYEEMRTFLSRAEGKLMITLP